MKIVRYILLLLLTALLLLGVYWARKTARDAVCRQVVVEVENGDSATLVTPGGIKTDLERQHFKFEGCPMWQINSEQVEDFLVRSPFLEKANVVKTGDGRLLICVKQIVPLLRVFDGDSSYYVNRTGKRMAAIANYYADVPVVNGHFTQRYGPERLLPLIEYVEHDPTLSAIVSQYNFVDSGNVFIVPVFYGHVVNMGSIDNYQSKLKKLLLFYRKVLPVKGWETYDTITLKWRHQVVATLRHQRSGEVMEYDPDADEQMPDMETMTGVDEAKTMVKANSDEAANLPVQANEAKKAETTAGTKAAGQKLQQASPTEASQSGHQSDQRKDKNQQRKI